MNQFLVSLVNAATHLIEEVDNKGVRLHRESTGDLVITVNRGPARGRGGTSRPPRPPAPVPATPPRAPRSPAEAARLQHPWP